MKNLLNSVLVVDHSYESGRKIENIIKENNIATDIAVAYNSWTALNYLKQRLAVGKPLPNLTFIDIDLPQLSAWDFLSQLKDQIGITPYHEIYLLSSDSSTDDMIKAGINPLAAGIINKPVTDREINNIALEYAKRNMSDVA